MDNHEIHPNHQEEGRKIMNLAEIKQFVLQQKYTIGPEFLAGNLKPTRPCVDSRHPKKDINEGPENPRTPVPGGDAGDVMTMMGTLQELHVPFETATHAVESAVFQVLRPDQFYMHTDSHALPGEHNDAHPSDCACPGCGHLRNATEDPFSYHMTREGMQWVNTFLLNMQTNGSQPEVLEGYHNELAALIVLDPSLGIKTDGKVFVYNKPWAMRVLDMYAHLLAEQSDLQALGLNEIQIKDTLLKTHTAQANETFDRLAVKKGIPVATVNTNQYDARSVIVQMISIPSK